MTYKDRGFSVSASPGGRDSPKEQEPIESQAARVRNKSAELLEVMINFMEPPQKEQSSQPSPMLAPLDQVSEYLTQAEQSIEATHKLWESIAKRIR